MAKAQFYSAAGVRRLVEALDVQANHVVRLGCTCTPDQGVRFASGHAPGCAGVRYAGPALALVRRWRHRLKEDLDAAHSPR